ncbi:MAG: N-formylglutamate amidohydrolase [Thermaurantiacus sp.]
MTPFRWIAGRAGGPLLVCDHASNLVPDGVDLGLPTAAMETHIALDIGAGPLTEALAARLDAPAILGRWSRLVADCNRPIDHPGFGPEASDGVPVPGNVGLDGPARAARKVIHIGYHRALAEGIARHRPSLLVSVHSFTPVLAAEPGLRPWPVAILWNHDMRAAGLALAELGRDRRVGGPVGANEPYSGRILNYSMDRHAEAGAIAYIGFEVRQDGISDAGGVARWAEILGDCVVAVEMRLE